MAPMGVQVCGSHAEGRQHGDGSSPCTGLGMPVPVPTKGLSSPSTHGCPGSQLGLPVTRPTESAPGCVGA